MSGYYSEKLIVLTGGAGGLALATAPLFLERGGELLLIDIDQARLDTAVASLGAADRVRTHVSDLSTPAKCADALDAAGKPIYALIHYAGIFVKDMGMPEENRDVYDRTIAANLTSAYDIAFAFESRHVTEEPARLVLVSSMAFRRGAYDYAAYSAAKGGLVGLVRALARRWGPKVHVNGLAPGIIMTDMPKQVLAARGDEIKKGIPLQRFGEPAECAAVAEFLCGPASSYMTSQVLNVDGGVFST